MRIAQIAPLVESVPPRHYGGTERVVFWLTEELVRQGHQVTLFASGDSMTSANLEPIVPRNLRSAGKGDHAPDTLLMLKRAFAMADRFDLIHFHLDTQHFPLFYHLRHKCVTTFHGRLDLPVFSDVFNEFPGMPLISISDNQRLPASPTANWLATIHHGLPGNLIGLGEGLGNYLLFLGRIAPEKRPDRAIEIAKRAGVKLKIAAKVDAADRKYFSQSIAPMLDDPLIDFVGEVDDRGKAALLKDAMALLFPIDWPEPFGLVMIEAMAAGTPVIAWPLGSVPEIIQDGHTGAVVDTMDDAVAAVNRVAGLNRLSIRRVFDARFSASSMAQNYDGAYRRLISASVPIHRRAPAKHFSSNEPNIASLRAKDTTSAAVASPAK